MKIEILGSGGALTTPRPGCACRVCAEARALGIPYSRGGPSAFVHGINLLIDTPEDIHALLNRAGIMRVDACLYSHWHPDHVAGRRVFESLNGDWTGWPPHNRSTDVYAPQQVAQDFRVRLGTWDQLTYLQDQGYVRLIELTDGQTITLDNVTIRPFRLAQDFVYAFLLEQGGTRALIAPDELFGWTPPDFARGVDLAILPMGLTDRDPFTGGPNPLSDHPVTQVEATFEQTLAIVRQLGARHTILTHVEEPCALSYDDLRRLESKLRGEGWAIMFAYDGLTVEV